MFSTNLKSLSIYLNSCLLQNTELRQRCTTHTYQKYPCASFYSFRNRKFTSVRYMKIWRTLKETWRCSFIQYQKRILRDASNDSKLAGVNALNAKGTILKTINVSYIVHLCLSKYSLNFDTFFIHSVIKRLYFRRIRPKYIDVYLPDPSTWAGCDTRSIFYRSLTGLDSKVSFSYTGCCTNVKSPIIYP